MKESLPKQSRKRPPATTPEGRENQLVSLAIDLAEKQLLNGTASSQVISHYLKLGSSTNRLERDILELQKELIQAKTGAIQSGKDMHELYTKAINAMRSYSGMRGDEGID